MPRGPTARYGRDERKVDLAIKRADIADPWVRDIDDIVRLTPIGSAKERLDVSPILKNPHIRMSKALSDHFGGRTDHFCMRQEAFL